MKSGYLHGLENFSYRLILLAREKKDNNSLMENSDNTLIEVRSFNDHRIAMSAAIAATVSDRPLLLTQAEAVSKSYPTFYEHYKSLGGQVQERR